MIKRSPKVISTTLMKDDNQVKLKFHFDEEVKLNFENEDINEIKKVFLKIAYVLKDGPISLSAPTIDKSIDSKLDTLFIETAQVYVNQLNSELEDFENDEELKKVRLIK